MSFSLGETSGDLVLEAGPGAKGWRLGLKFWPGAKGIGSGGFTFSTSKGKRRHWGIQIGKEGSRIVDEKGYKGKIETDPLDEELTGWKEFLATDGDMVKRMMEIEEELKKSIIGQEIALEKIAKSIRRNRVGIRNPKNQ